MKTRVLVIPMAVYMMLMLVTYCWSGDDATGDVTLKVVRSALQNRQYKEAVRLVDTLTTEPEEDYDFMMYLKGLALFHDKGYNNAIAACDKVIADTASACSQNAQN